MVTTDYSASSEFWLWRHLLIVGVVNMSRDLNQFETLRKDELLPFNKLPIFMQEVMLVSYFVLLHTWWYIFLWIQVKIPSGENVKTSSFKILTTGTSPVKNPCDS